MNPLNTLNHWKNQPYKRTNYENIQVHYGDLKFIKMKPKSFIALTPGLLTLILKKKREWILQEVRINEEINLINDTSKVLYYTIEDSVFFDEEKELKVSVRPDIGEELKEGEIWI